MSIWTGLMVSAATRSSGKPGPKPDAESAPSGLASPGRGAEPSSVPSRCRRDSGKGLPSLPPGDEDGPIRNRHSSGKDQGGRSPRDDLEAPAHRCTSRFYLGPCPRWMSGNGLESDGAVRVGSDADPHLACAGDSPDPGSQALSTWYSAGPRLQSVVLQLAVVRDCGLHLGQSLPAALRYP